MDASVHGTRQWRGAMARTDGEEESLAFESIRLFAEPLAVEAEVGGWIVGDSKPTVRETWQQPSECVGSQRQSLI